MEFFTFPCILFFNPIFSQPFQVLAESYLFEPFYNKKGFVASSIKIKRCYRGGKYLRKYEQILTKLKYMDYKTKLGIIHYFIRTKEGKEFAKKYTTTLQRKYYQIQDIVFETQ